MTMRSCGRLIRNTTPTEMATATTVKNQRCQPPATARKLKAAPGLCISTRLRKGRTSRTSPGVNARLTHALVARSAAATAADSRSQRAPPLEDSRMGPRFPRAVEVGDAARADAGMLRIRAHVGAVMPAALALGVGARRDGDL